MFLNKSLFYTTLLSVCFFNQIAYAVEPRPVNCNQVLKGNSVYTALNEKRLKVGTILMLIMMNLRHFN